MPKSLKNRAKGFVKTSSKIAEKALPKINNGLKTATTIAKDVAKESIPIVEKGVTAVYDTMATGYNLGAKEVKKVAKGVKNATAKKSKGGRRKSRRCSRRRKY